MNAVRASCPTDAVLQGYMDDLLSAGQCQVVATHLKGCATCREALAQYEGLMGQVEGALAAQVVPGSGQGALARIQSNSRYQRAMLRLSERDGARVNEMQPEVTNSSSGLNPLDRALQAIQGTVPNPSDWLPRLARSKLAYTAAVVVVLAAVRYAYSHRHGVTEDHGLGRVAGKVATRGIEHKSGHFGRLWRRAASARGAALLSGRDEDGSSTEAPPTPT